MVTKLTYDSGLGQGISSLGSSIGQALQERAKKARIEAIMKPMQQQAQGQPTNVPQDQSGTVLGGIVGQPQEQNANALAPSNYQQLQPVADQIYNNKLAEIQHKKKQAEALMLEGKQPQATMIMQEAHQAETMLQKERLQDKSLSQKASTQKDKRAFDENKPYYEDVRKKRTEMGNQQATLLNIRDTLKDSGGNISRMRNLISTFAPFEAQDYIKDANAQQLSSFVKDFFVADLKGMPGGSKLNQLIEKNLLSALQSPGKTEESNQKITEFQQYKQDVIEKEIEIFDRMRAQYLKAGMEPPEGMQQKVHEQLKPYVLEKQRDLIQTFENIKNGKFKSAQMLNMPFAKAEVKDTPAKPGFTWIISPEGKPVQAPNDQLKIWLDGGGKLIK